MPHSVRVKRGAKLEYVVGVVLHVETDRYMSSASDSSSTPRPSTKLDPYVPPMLRSKRGLLLYYAIVLPVALAAGWAMWTGGAYAQVGLYVTVGLFAVVAVAYSAWLAHSLFNRTDGFSGTPESAAEDNVRSMPSSHRRAA